MGCSGCESTQFACRDGITVESIGIEHSWDDRIQTEDYGSTQENVVIKYLKQMAPTVVVFNTGLHDSVVPSGGNLQESRLENETDQEWTQRRIEILKSHSVGYVEYYAAGLRKYATLLRTHLPDSLLLWLRTTSPKGDPDNPWSEVSTSNTSNHLTSHVAS